MTCSPLALWTGSPPDPQRATTPTGQWEPALSQLRQLSRPELDRLVRTWLVRLGLPPVRPTDSGTIPATYHGLLTTEPVPVALRVRVYQRRTRLGVQHVEAFAGHLLRAGVHAGLLVTTGEFTREARVLADAFRTPRLRLYAGSEWAAELATSHLGVKRGQLWRWVLALTPPPRDLPSPLDERDGGGQ